MNEGAARQSFHHITSLFGALRHGPIRGAERRQMRYTAKRCNEWSEWRNCVAETMTKARATFLKQHARSAYHNSTFIIQNSKLRDKRFQPVRVQHPYALVIGFDQLFFPQLGLDPAQRFRGHAHQTGQV